MPKQSRTNQIAILCLIGLILWWLPQWFIGDERSRVRSRLDELVAAASFEGEIHPFEQLAYAKEISSFFDEQIKLELLDQDGVRPVIASRDELKEKLVLVRRFLDQLAVAVWDIEVSVNGKAADVTLQGRAMGRETGREDYFLEQNRISLALQKSGGSWIIVQGRNLDPIETVYHGD